MACTQRHILIAALDCFPTSSGVKDGSEITFFNALAILQHSSGSMLVLAEHYLIGLPSDLFQAVSAKQCAELAHDVYPMVCHVLCYP